MTDIAYVGKKCLTVCMKITILSVGKKSRGAEEDIILEYQKRIQKPWNVVWQFISHGSGDPESAKKAESKSILDMVSSDNCVILLDERGSAVDNNELASMFDPEKVTQDIVIIIGGAYGVDDRVRERANATVSLSSLVLPHKLVRILLMEQLYRSQSILLGHPYHHS